MEQRAIATEDDGFREGKQYVVVRGQMDDVLGARVLLISPVPGGWWICHIVEAGLSGRHNQFGAIVCEDRLMPAEDYAREGNAIDAILQKHNLLMPPRQRGGRKTA